MIGRRAALRGTGRLGAGLLGAGLLGGCGFEPLYLPRSGGRRSVADVEMAAVFVPPLPERYGQLMRQALQQLMYGTGTAVAKQYELIASAAIVGEPIGVQRDSSSTRVRLSATAPWVLRRLDLAHTQMASGTSRTVDGFNIINAQYFAADIENESATKRVCDELASQIVSQVAIFFRRRGEQAPPA